jgi:hypothetical protein
MAEMQPMRIEYFSTFFFSLTRKKGEERERQRERGRNNRIASAHAHLDLSNRNASIPPSRTSKMASKKPKITIKPFRHQVQMDPNYAENT